jgi:hypothetical protein
MMDCPKCGATQSAGNRICERCGLVFEKYWKYHPRPGETPAPRPSPSSSNRRGRGARRPGRLTALLLPPPAEHDPLALGAQAALLLALSIWSLALIGSPLDENAAGKSFLHLVNLPFHEAGHVFFAPLGDFMQSLGGTLGQLLMPLTALLVLLLKTRDPFGASVALWWLGENFLDIAPYINDARAGVLPLLGGNTGQGAPYGFHDWEYLLTETGLLHLDHQLAQASHTLGSLIMLLALGWGAVLVYRRLTAARRP